MDLQSLVLQAVATAQSPAASQQQRLEAVQFIEQVRRGG